MRKLAIVLAVLLIALAAGGYIVASAEPTRETLEQDMAGVRAVIAAAKAERNSAGGLLKDYADARVKILKNTEAMLDQKRLSMLRMIELSYVVEGRDIEPASPEAPAEIEADLATQKSKLAEAEAKRSPQGGGLIGAISAMEVATIRATIAALEQRRLTAKYGLALPVIDIPSTAPSKPAPPGKPAEDKDAL